MTTNFEQLSARQTKAVQALAMGMPCKAVAELVGVTPECISKWKRQAHFQAALNQLRRDLYDTVRDRLLQTSLAAVDALEKHLTSTNKQISLAAAQSVLRLAFQGSRQSSDSIWSEAECLSEEPSLHPESTTEILASLRDCYHGAHNFFEDERPS